MLKRLVTTKTFWTALLGIGAVVVAWAFGEVGPAAAIGSIWLAVQSITWRDAFAKGR